MHPVLGKLFARTKSIHDIEADATDGRRKLARHLTAFDLTMIGIGGIIGAGIFVLTGTAAATKAGPAVVLSFVFSGVGCAFAGFCYAELASTIPVAGSAYTYAYATLGEIIAWIIGWDLILEYVVASITVSIGWSGYLVKWLEGYGLMLPSAWTHGTFDGGIVNLPAVLLVVAITALLIRGIKASARATAVLVLIKLGVIVLFLVLGVPWVRPAHWSPFFPFGWSGVIAGAGVIFFAYIGFDAVTTTSEETRNPQRDLPIGILTSLVVCTVLYVLVALVLTGMVPFTELNHPAPVALALEKVGITWGMQLVSVGAVVGLASVVIVMMTGQPRVFFAMSRDGLLSPWIAKVHGRFHTPYRATLITGAVVALGAGTLSIQVAGEMTSIGTLFAFVVVCVGVIVLRRTRPDLRRGFKAPWNPFVPAAGALLCFTMMCGLEFATWVRFLGWMVVGLVIYVLYGRHYSHQKSEDLP
ncbi:MAG: amino acid permease [Myxococcales bacterium]|nr:amino acid permease [Myxococcales bacterium]MCB9707906.1 amino acid permease [Myxococcales bacterium]